MRTSVTLFNLLHIFLNSNYDNGITSNKKDHDNDKNDDEQNFLANVTSKHAIKLCLTLS